MNDLPLYLHKVVRGVDELQLHVAHRGTHLGIHCLAEEEQLIFIDRIFALVDELDDILQFLAQSLQFYFLYLIVRLVLIRAVQIPFQVDHVAYRGERYVLERTAHVIIVVISPSLVILFQIILYLLVQLAEMFLYIGYIHLFVHLQHLLEELQVNVFHLQEIAATTYHSVIDQALYPLLLIIGQLHREIVFERKGGPFMKHLT